MTKSHYSTTWKTAMKTDNAFWIKNKVAYARSEGVQALLGVSREMLSQYVKTKDMPFEKDGLARIYNLQEILKWKVSQESKKVYDTMDDEEIGEDFTKMPMEKLNRAMKVYGTKKLKHESKIKEIQEKAEMGVFIPADKLDRNMAELSNAFITVLKEVRQVLPPKIEKMDAGSIEDILDEYFEKLFLKMKKAAENV